MRPKVVGRPRRIFRRDEVLRLRDVEGLSWRAIGTKLGIPAMTALDSYRNPAPCTETVSAGTPDPSGKRKRKNGGRIAVRIARFFGQNGPKLRSTV